VLTPADIESAWATWQERSRSAKDSLLFVEWALETYSTLSSADRSTFHGAVLQWLSSGRPGYDPHRDDALYLVREWRLGEAAPIIEAEIHLMRCALQGLERSVLRRFQPWRGRIAVLRGAIDVYERALAELRGL